MESQRLVKIRESVVFLITLLGMFNSSIFLKCLHSVTRGQPHIQIKKAFSILPKAHP